MSGWQSNLFQRKSEQQCTEAECRPHSPPAAIYLSLFPRLVPNRIDWDIFTPASECWNLQFYLPYCLGTTVVVQELTHEQWGCSTSSEQSWPSDFHLQMFMIQHWKILLTKPNGMVMEVSGMLKLENPDKFIFLFAFIPHRLQCSFLISPEPDFLFNLFYLNADN